VLPGDAFVTSWGRADRFTLLAVARNGSAEGRASSAHEEPHAGPAGLPAGPDAPPAGKPLDDDERATLLAAQRGSDELLELKAGLDLTDREIKLMAGTAIVVVILALIL
jgi:hypothetical protein